MSNDDRLGLDLVMQGLAQFMRDAQRGQSAVDKFGRSLTDTERDSDKLDSSLDGLSKRGLFGVMTAANLAADAITALTRRLADAASSAVSTAIDFESQMALMGIAARGTGADIDELRQFAIDMGAQTFESAQGAAEGMTNLLKAGLDAQEVYAAFPAIIDLSAASSLSLAQASDAVTVSMATFGLEATDAAKIVDNYVKSADASVTEVNELVAAMSNIGPVAADFGLSLDDTNTALAILSQRGIRGAEAGTALRSMLLNLNRDTSDVREMMAQLGITMFDAQGEIRPFQYIVGDLAEAFSELTDEQRLQAAQTLAGSFGIKALNALIADGTKVIELYDAPGSVSDYQAVTNSWLEMTRAIDQAAGSADIAAARFDTTKGRLEELAGGLETLAIQIGTPILENVLTPVLDFLNDTLLPAISDLFAGESFIDVLSEYFNIDLSGLIATLQPLLDVIQGVGDFIGDAINTVFGTVIQPETTFAEWTGSAERMQNVIDMFASDTAQTTSDAFSTAFDQIGATRSPVAGLFEEMTAPFENAQLIADYAQDTQTALSNADFVSGQFRQRTLSDVLMERLGISSDTITTIETAWSTLRNTIETVVGEISGFVTTSVIPTLETAFNEVVTFVDINIIPLLEDAASRVGGAISDLLFGREETTIGLGPGGQLTTETKRVRLSLVDILNERFDIDLSGIETFVENAAQVITTALRPVADFIENLAQLIIAFVTGETESISVTAGGGGVGIVSPTGDVLTSEKQTTVRKHKLSLAELVDKYLGIDITGLETWIERAQGTIEAALAPVLDFIGNLGGFLSDLFSQAMGQAAGPMEIVGMTSGGTFLAAPAQLSLSDLVLKWFDLDVSGLFDTIESVIGNVVTFLETQFGSIQKVFTTLEGMSGEELKNIGVGLVTIFGAFEIITNAGAIAALGPAILIVGGAIATIGGALAAANDFILFLEDLGGIVSDVLAGDWEGALWGLGDAMKHLGDTILSFLTGGAQSIVDLLGIDLDVVEGINAFGRALENLGRIVTFVVGVAFKWIGDNVISPFKDIIDGIITALETAWSIVEVAVDAFRTGIEAAFQPIIDNIISPLLTQIEGVVDVLETIWNAVKTPVENFASGIMEKLQPIIDFVQGIIDKINELKSTLDTAVFTYTASDEEREAKMERIFRQNAITRAGGLEAYEQYLREQGRAETEITQLTESAARERAQQIDELAPVIDALGGIAPFASGGAVIPNVPVLVGEAGPELFVPTMAGSIIPSGMTQQIMNSQSADYSKQTTFVFEGDVLDPDSAVDLLSQAAVRYGY